MEFFKSVAARLQELLVITDANGNPVTLFGGRITLSQFVLFLAVLVLFLSLLRYLKGVLKLLAFGVIVIGLCINFGLFSAKEVKDVAGRLTKAGTDTIEQIAKTSESVRVNDGVVEILLDGNWYDIASIDTFEIVSGKVVIWMGETQYRVEDSSIVAALESLL